jgi:hypothetical protein
MTPDYKISRQSIVNMMSREYKAEKVTPHYKSETIFSGSEKYMFKLIVAKDFNTYLTIIDNLEDYQVPVINVHGDALEVKNILEKSDVKIKEVSPDSIKWMNNFISKVNEIVLQEKFKLYEKENYGNNYNQKIKSANTEFHLSINVVYYINEDLSLTERLNCQFSAIVYNGYLVQYKESIKFKLHGNDFIAGNFFNTIENVEPDFLEKKIKKIFLNYNKDIIKTYDLCENQKEILKKDNEFENLKEVIKMIRY